MNFNFSISTSCGVSVKLFDATGCCLLYKQHQLYSGNYNWEFDLKKYKTGVMYYSFQSASEIKNGKIILY
ncbi:hypothetical protein EMN47_09875 [Prolixibacteraceae bacterium JC049]|nr:hypothetical protein [Prolixibacteraceae bacterium JC049]